MASLENTLDANGVLSSIGLLLFVGTSIASLVRIGWSRREGEKRIDILQSILEKTAPVAAAKELESLPKGCRTCERRLNGAPLIITKDHRVADYVFNGPSNKLYRLRPASDEGLNELGMLNRGLIWNNEISSWVKIRECFQKALKASNLKKAASVIELESDAILAVESQRVDGSAGVDMLEISRRLTFRVGLSVFFGIHSGDFSKRGIDEPAFISSIVAYFKAW
jgi:hypothetical protein